MPANRPFTHSSLESLETRIAPATLTATLSNGILKITALSPGTAVQGAVNFIDADSVLVSDGLDAPIPFDGVHSIKVVLSDQSDSLDFLNSAGTFRGPISISAGDGADLIGFGTSPGAGISGDITVVAKGAANVTVQNGGHITGALNVTTGPAGAVALGEGGATVGALITKNVLTVGLSPSSIVAGDVRIIAPDLGVIVTAAGTIQGNLSVKGGASISSSDAVHLMGATYGAVSLVLGEGGSLVDAMNSSVAGNFSISGKSGPDTVNLFATGIGGALKISLGDGTNLVSMRELSNGQSRISGGVRIVGGAGNDTVGITFETIGGVARFDLGEGTNSVTTFTSKFYSGLVLTGGAGSDTVQMNPGSVIAGAAKFSLGDGLNSTSVISGNTFDRGLTIVGGKDNDAVALNGCLLQGKTMLSLGEGTNTFAARSSTFRTNFTYLGTNAGADAISFDAYTVLSGTLTVNAGDGNNQLTMSTLSDLSSLSYKGGKDADTVFLEAAGGYNGLNALAGQYLRGKVVLGDGDDTATLRNSVFFSLSLDPGAGADQLNITAAALAAAPIIKAPGFETQNIIS